MKPKSKKILLILGVVALLVYGAISLGILPVSVDILVKDSNGLPIEGAKCQIMNPPGCDSGMASCRLTDETGSNGRCNFGSLQCGEIISWGVSCPNPSGITKQGSTSVACSNNYAFTGNVDVTLSGCHSVVGATTTTTIKDSHCGSPYTNKCYNSDVWEYDSCGNRNYRIETCQNGCTGGKCIVTTPTTQPPTPTTQPNTVTTSSTTTTLPHSGLGGLSTMTALIIVGSMLVIAYFFIRK